MDPMEREEKESLRDSSKAQHIAGNRAYLLRVGEFYQRWAAATTHYSLSHGTQGDRATSE